jgi:hypothetical protein
MRCSIRQQCVEGRVSPYHPQIYMLSQTYHAHPLQALVEIFGETSDDIRLCKYIQLQNYVRHV